MALSATGDFAPFTDVAEAALRGLTGYTISDEQVARFMAAFGELPAFPDALPAMSALTQAGVRVACLTNGSASLTLSFLRRAGLGSLVDRVVSVGEVYRWKAAGGVHVRRGGAGSPAAADGAGRRARLGLPRRQAGRADRGWVSRKSGGYGAPFEPPDVVGEDLTDVAGQLLALER